MTLTVRWWQTKSMVLVIVEAMVVAMVVVLKVETEVVRMVANPETYAGVRWSDLYGLARHCANPHPLGTPSTPPSCCTPLPYHPMGVRGRMGR
ncbi:hypothetical protein HZH68_000574 [Vespula germanica]|uniref:Uncharacterized protein n=1 Tax=Vespula germanica TaxID=30212 RepID=A0A834NU38_VESGE|nr:hypothetical protein HZH68_000574 [Vespula germanica]